MARPNPLANCRYHYNQREHLIIKSLATSLTLVALLYSCQYNIVTVHADHAHKGEPVRIPLASAESKSHHNPAGSLADPAGFQAPATHIGHHQGPGANEPASPTTAPATKSTAAPSQSPSAAPDQNDPTKLKEFEEFKRSPLYLEPYEAHIKYLPDKQVEFIRQSAATNFALFKKIINEAIETRNNVMPGTRLMVKYGAKLVAAILKHRRGEMAIKGHHEPQKSWFLSIANLLDDGVKRSTVLKKERKYKKNNIDVEAFRKRAMAAIEYITKIINKSPLASYHKWGGLKLFMDDPANPKHKADVVEEVADLYAQFRAMGYENVNFVVQRIVSMLKMFSRGIVAKSEKDISR